MDVFLKRPQTQSQNTAITVQAVLPSHIREAPTESLLESQEPHDTQLKAFMASLTPNERIAHSLATELLGTSYDIRRTHGFVRWMKSLSPLGVPLRER